MPRIKLDFDDLKEVRSIFKKLAKVLEECEKTNADLTKSIGEHEGESVDQLVKNQELIQKKLPYNKEMMNDFVDFIDEYIAEMGSQIHPTGGMMLVDSGSIELNCELMVNVLTNITGQDTKKVFNNHNPYIDDYSSLPQKSGVPKLTVSPEKAQQYRRNKLKLAELPIMKRRVVKDSEPSAQIIENIAKKNVKMFVSLDKSYASSLSSKNGLYNKYSSKANKMDNFAKEKKKDIKTRNKAEGDTLKGALGGISDTVQYPFAGLYSLLDKDSKWAKDKFHRPNESVKNTLSDPYGEARKFVESSRISYEDDRLYFMSRLIATGALIYITKKLAQKVKISYKNRVKFGKNTKNHLINMEKFGKNGASGGHNYKKFLEGLRKEGLKTKDIIISKRKHPTIPGLYEYEYRIPLRDKSGNFIKPPKYKGKGKTKTVYHPDIISDDKMYRWGKQAMKNATYDKTSKSYVGKAKNGLKFRGYKDKNGNFKNFYPIIN